MTHEPLLIRDFHALRAALVGRRVALGLTPEEAAERAGLTPHRVRQFETGRICLGGDALPALIKALRLQLHAVPRTTTRAAA